MRWSNIKILIIVNSKVMSKLTFKLLTLPAEGRIRNIPSC